VGWHGNSLSAVGNSQDETAKTQPNANRLNDSQLGSKNDRLATVGKGEKEVRPAGLEPAASGLGNRRSIRLSYGRFSYNRLEYNDLPHIESTIF
jgi:hypothetical protein